MRRTLAHGMRRAARALIGWSTKLDPPHRDHVHTAIRYAGQHAGIGVRGLLETFE